MSEKEFPYIDTIYNQQVENKYKVEQLSVSDRISLLKKLETEILTHREEIAEALSVAISLNAGAALTYTARVLEAVDTLPNQ